MWPFTSNRDEENDDPVPRFEDLNFNRSQRRLSLRDRINNFLDSLNALNYAMEKAFRETYFSYLFQFVNALSALVHFLAVICIKAPLCLLYTLTISPVVLIDMLSVKLLAIAPVSQQVSFSDIFNILRIKFDRSLFDLNEFPDEPNRGASDNTDQMLKHMYSLSMDALTAPLPDGAKEGWKAIGIKSLIAVYSILTLIPSTILMLINISIIESSLDYLLPGIMQYGIRTIVNAVCAVPFLIFEGGKKLHNKIKQRFYPDEFDGIDLGPTPTSTELERMHQNTQTRRQVISELQVTHPADRTSGVTPSAENSPSCFQLLFRFLPFQRRQSDVNIGVDFNNRSDNRL